MNIYHREGVDRINDYVPSQTYTEEYSSAMTYIVCIHTGVFYSAVEDLFIVRYLQCTCTLCHDDEWVNGLRLTVRPVAIKILKY